MRIGILAGISFLTALCVFLENLLIIGEVQGGFSDLSRAVQSIPECANVLLPVSIWQYLGMMLFWKFLVLFFISLFLLFFVLTMKGYLQAFFISMILLVGEYLAYLHIDFHSPFRAFKYVNLFAWLDAEWCMRQYLNFNIFGYPVGLYEMMCVFVPLLIVVFILLMLYSGNIRPFAIREGIWKKGMQKIMAVCKPYRHGNMLFFEYYKQFIVQKMGILVLAAFVAGVFYYNDNPVYYNYQDTLYNAYMEMLSGEVTEEKLVYLQSEQEIWQKKYEKELEILENAENLNESQVKSAQLRSEQFEEAMFCVQQLETEAIRLLEQKKAGEQVCFVNKIAYEHLIGKKSMQRNQQDGLLLLAFGTLFGAVLFSSEQAQNSKALIKSTKNGRKKFLICKYITLFTAELLIFLPVIISTFATVRNRYGITGLSASIKSLPFTTDFPFDINIQNAIILAYTLEFLILYCIMSGITLLFGRMKNVMAAVLCSMAVFVLPAALWLMGFAQAEVLTILDELAVCGWLF